MILLVLLFIYILFDTSRNYYYGFYVFFLDVFNTSTVVYFCICAYFLTLWTYGVHFSGGVLIPGLCTGAAWGRLVGLAVFHFLPNTV